MLVSDIIKAGNLIVVLFQEKKRILSIVLIEIYPLLKHLSSIMSTHCIQYTIAFRLFTAELNLLPTTEKSWTDHS